MTDTKFDLTESEVTALKAALEHAKNAPVMNFRVGEPTLAESAWDDLRELANATVRAHGFDSEKYGVSTGTWSIVPL